MCIDGVCHLPSDVLVYAIEFVGPTRRGRRLERDLKDDLFNSSYKAYSPESANKAIKRCLLV